MQSFAAVGLRLPRSWSPSPLVTGAGAVVGLLGFSVLIGWYVGSIRLMQVAPAFAPMQYNTALGLLLSGLGLISLNRGRAPTVATILGAVVLTLGVGTLAQYAFGINLGIDELFMRHYVTVQTSHPGRMAPNTALCLALVGSTLLLASRETFERWLPISVGGSVVSGLGAVALLGYLSGVEAAYGWGQLTRMAVHTAFGFVVLGTGVCAHVAERVQGARVAEASDEAFAGPSLVSMVAILLVTAIAMWQGLRATEVDRMQRDLELEAQRVASVMDREFSFRVPALIRVAARWRDRGGTPEQEWRGDVGRYIADELGYQAIEWVDAANVVRWTVPHGGNEAAVGFDLSRDPLRREALDRARQSGRVTTTPPLDLISGGRGFELAVPIGAGDTIDGFIVGVFRLPDLLDNVLSNEPEDYGMAIFDGATEVYRRPPGAPLPRSEAAAESEVVFSGRTWLVRVWATPHMVANARSPLPWIVLLFMGSGALLIPAILHTSRRAELASRRLDRANRELAQEVEKLDGVIAACPNGIVIVDDQGRITLVNSEAERLFGYREDELIGQPIELLQPASYRDRHVAYREEFQQAPSRRLMIDRGQGLMGRRKDGSVFPVEIGLSPMQTPEGPGVLSAIADISDRKHAEQVAAARTLELERSNAELEQFAYVAAHDLQEPLRMVSSYTELLGQRYRGQLDDDADIFIGFAVEGSRRMKHLLEGLLAYSRVGTGDASFERLDSSEAVAAALANLDRALRESDAEVLCGDLPVLAADRVQLVQVFQNLIGNAVKFRRPDEPPRVRATASLTGEEWTFRVEDNGLGIEPAYFERIFRVFQRLHTRDQYEGSGIGLAITKKIVERHGGTLSVESKPGEGSVFSFTIARDLPLEGPDR